MKKTLYILFIVFGFLISAINSNAQNDTKEAPDQNPEFPNQTRAPSISTQADYQVSMVTDELSFPWGMDFLPNGDLIISEKPGRIRIISQEGKVGPPLLGIPPVRYEGSGGLFDVKLSPSFEKDRKVFWSYVSTKNSEAMNQVASGTLSPNQSKIENVKVIYEIEPISGGRFHFGSRLLFDSEGMLLVTFGDRFRNGREKVQQLNSALGKIIRITPEGNPAPGNPFEGQAGALPEIWSVGHRNPQGLAFHPETHEQLPKEDSCTEYTGETRKEIYRCGKQSTLSIQD
jgi:glucose/arabinose dehydrogenase